MHSKSPYDAIFTDLDGTLLGESGQLTDFTRRTLAQVAAQGVRVVAATGRPLPSVRRLLANLEFPVAAITLNGTVVHTDLWSDAPLSVHAIAPEIVGAVGDFLLTQPGETNLSFDCVDCWYALRRCRLSGLFQEMYDAPPKPLRLPWCETTPVLNIVIASSGDRKALAAELRERFGDHVMVTEYRQWPMVELTHKTRTKGAALKEICSHWGIDIARTAAFGDGENDRELMEAAGHAFAVANAQPEILALARQVIPKHSEDGVAHTLQSLLSLV